MLLNTLPSRILRRFIPASLPPTGTFDGQTVLIVGGTAGIGLAAAVHFATLGANVIITYRIASRGDAAKRHIEEAVGPSRKGEISSLKLDLEHYTSCTGFMTDLKRSVSGSAALDVALVNGGIVNSYWEESLEGWERTIQVNTLGSTLIGLLLLNWMREGRDQRQSPAHITFLSSREHLDVDFNRLILWSQKENGILRQVCSKENWPEGFWDVEPNYPISKLFLMYTIEEITRLARGPDGDPLVIVNSVCPGMVNTDIGRQIASKTWFHALCLWITLLIMAKSADLGSRICVLAALKPNENHGDFFNYWLTADQYHRKASVVIHSKKARSLQKLVWKEIIEELKTHVPELSPAAAVAGAEDRSLQVN